MDYPKSDPTVGLKDGKFTDGNPVTGEKASRDKAVHQNMLYDELIGVIQHAGLTPSDADHTQIVKALKSAFGRPRLLWEQTVGGQATPLTKVEIDGLNSNIDRFYTLHYSFTTTVNYAGPFDILIYPNGLYPSDEWYSQFTVADNASLSTSRVNDPLFGQVLGNSAVHGVMHITRPDTGGISILSTMDTVLQSGSNVSHQQASIITDLPDYLLMITRLTIESKDAPLMANFRGRLFATDVAL